MSSFPPNPPVQSALLPSSCPSLPPIPSCRFWSLQTNQTFLSHRPLAEHRKKQPIFGALFPHSDIVVLHAVFDRYLSRSTRLLISLTQQLSHHVSEPSSLDLPVARTRCAYQLCSLCRGRLLEICSASAQIAASRRNQLNIADSAPRGKADSQSKNKNICNRGVAAQQQQEVVLLIFYNLLSNF